MSTDFFIACPMAEFVERAKDLGWREGESSSGQFALVSPSGHYCHKIYEVPAGTCFVRFGQNTEVYDLAEALGAVCEDDVGFDGIIARSEGRIQ